MVAMPGLVDCHTHACFAGDRVDEYDRRARGATYEELHAAGGGILSTVAATRAAGLDLLTENTGRHLRWMLEQGTTTVEIKSGYGLDLDTELDMLRAVRSAEAVGSQRLFSTRARGARRAAGGRGRRCLHPALHRRDPARGRRVGARDGRRRVLRARARSTSSSRAATSRRRRSSGSSGACTATSSARSGAIQLAIDVEARSVDHLEATGPEGVAALAASDVIGVMLPAASLVLDRPMPPGRELIDAGAAIALASDFNPGSSFCESLPLVMALACARMKLTPAEALAACTVNAAAVLGQADRFGRLRAGYQADIVLLDAPDWRYLTYHLGEPAGEARLLRRRVGARGMSGAMPRRRTRQPGTVLP